jgi:cytochrome c oxidase subunit 3
MWFLLVVVLMTFGGLIGAYIVVSTNGVMEWKPFDLPTPIWISTFLIFTSSVTYHFAQKAIFQDNQPQAKKWLVATTFFGATFISSQLLAWFALVQRGVYVQSNPYAGFFYILTAVHALHVLGGIVALGSIVLRAWHQTASDEDSEKRKIMAQVVGWYWHFMGGLWLFLFLLLGFWK